MKTIFILLILILDIDGRNLFWNTVFVLLQMSQVRIKYMYKLCQIVERDETGLQYLLLHKSVENYSNLVNRDTDDNYRRKKIRGTSREINKTIGKEKGIKCKIDECSLTWIVRGIRDVRINNTGINSRPRVLIKDGKDARKLQILINLMEDFNLVYRFKRASSRECCTDVWQRSFMQANQIWICISENILIP